MDIKQIEKILNDYGYQFTNNPMEAIYIFPDGSMIDGMFDCGLRGEDHRLIECLMNSDRYDKHFWDDVHAHLKVVRLVPETKIGLIKVGQELTKKQLEILTSNGYEIEEY